MALAGFKKENVHKIVHDDGHWILTKKKQNKDWLLILVLNYSK